MTDQHTHNPFRNLFNIGIGDILSRAIAFATFVYLARVLGPEPIGLIAFGSSVVAFFLPVIDYGLGFVGTREVSRDPTALPDLLRKIVLVRLLLGASVMAVLIGVATILIQDPQKSRMVLLYTLTLVPIMINLTWAYQGIGQTWWFTLEKIIQAVLFFGGVLLWVSGPLDVESVPLLFALSAVLPAGTIFIRFILRYRRDDNTPLVKPAIGLLRNAFPLFISTVLGSVGLPAAILIVASFGSLEETGYFSVASKILVLTVMIPNLLWSSFYPGISNAAAASKTELDAYTKKLYGLAVSVGILALVLGPIYARDILGTIFGTSYDGAISSFRILSIAAGIQFISVVFTRIMPALGMDDTFQRAMWILAGLQVIVSLVLVPMYGAIGASVALLIAEVGVGAYALGTLRTTLRTALFPMPLMALSALFGSLLLFEGVRVFVAVPVMAGLVAVIACYATILFVIPGNPIRIKPPSGGIQ